VASLKAGAKIMLPPVLPKVFLKKILNRLSESVQDFLPLAKTGRFFVSFCVFEGA
jgi:hypothetical protein